MAKVSFDTKKLAARLRKVDVRTVMVLVIIGMSFVIGRLTQKVEDLSAGLVSSNTLGAAVTATNAPTPQAPTVSIDNIKGVWSKNVVKFGDANRKLLFVEIGDPSCPYCHVAAGRDPEINKQMGPQFALAADGGSYVPPVAEMKKLVESGKASFAYIYFPGHGNGEMGMKALYCANEKGKFWQAHDLLMSNAGYNLMNNTVKNDTSQSKAVADFLKSVVDPGFLKSCLDSGKYDGRLADDRALASSLGVQGTPGFFVNATSYPGAYSWSDMKATVDAALK
jgi:protein-disulfide isomerase